MTAKRTDLQQLIESGGRILIAEIAPPKEGNAEAVRVRARLYAGKAHALGVSDNRDEARMSALAAASIAAGEGVEPILHIVTRDRNRIALVSECLGARALGIGNLLCTTGTHQTLGAFRRAKGVFDIDSIQLLQAAASLDDEKKPFCLGGVAAPYSDPLEMQPIRLAKKVLAGAKFLVTQPVFDLERFDAWWEKIAARGLHEKAAFVAGVRLLPDAEGARVFAEKRPFPMVPEAILERIAAKEGREAQRAEGIEIALETIERLSSKEGLRGFEICGAGDDEAALEVIERAGLGADKD